MSRLQSLSSLFDLSQNESTTERLHQLSEKAQFLIVQRETSAEASQQIKQVTPISASDLEIREVRSTGDDGSTHIEKQLVYYTPPEKTNGYIQGIVYGEEIQPDDVLVAMPTQSLGERVPAPVNVPATSTPPPAKELREGILYFPEVPPQSNHSPIDACANSFTQPQQTPTSSTPMQSIAPQPALAQQPQINTESFVVHQRATSPAIHTHAETSAKASSYNEMRRFLQDVPVLRKNGLYYIFTGMYYRRLSIHDLPDLVVANNRDVIEKVGTPHFVHDIVKFIGMEPNIRVDEDHIHSTQVAFRNCVLDIKTGQVLSHSPAHRVFYLIETNYLYNQPQVSCPMFDHFLYTVCGGDTDEITRIWQMIGYLLTPDLAGKVFFLLQGVPSSGKSVLTSFLYQLFSPEAVYTLDAHDFGGQFSLAGMSDVTFCMSPDLDSTPLDSRSVSRIKQLTGKDLISTDIKFQDRKVFRPTAKLLMATNHPFLTRTPDEAFESRIITIPFRYAVPREHWDHDLLDKLLTERDAIVTQAMGYYFSLVANKYQFCGNYCPNMQVGGVTTPLDARSSVYAFVRQNTIISTDDGIFVEDAFDRFMPQCPSVTKEQFVRFFKEAAEQIHGTTHIRKRKNSNGNPLSFVQGIRFQ